MNLLIIFCGGGIGALLRYSIIISLPYDQNINIYLVNLIGCFLMGIIFAYFSNKGQIYVLLSIGIVGSFTTMSAFTNNSLEMMLATKYFQAFTYSLIMLVICLSANIIGYAFIKNLFYD